MRIGLVTLGSTGDLVPMLSLGIALRQAGHVPVLISYGVYADAATEHGLEIAPLPGDPRQIVASQAGRLTASKPSSIFRAARAMRAQAKQVESGAMQFMNLAYEAAAGCDLVAANVPQLGGGFAELAKLPSLHLAYYPHIPARTVAPITAKYDYGPLNPLAYRIEARVLEKPFLPMINGWRTKRGLQPLPLGRNHGRMDGYRQPVLFPFSRHLCPPPPEWNGIAEAVGFLQLPVERNWTMPADLEQFIAAGEPPVYIGFGSMVGSDPAQVTRTVLDALAGTGIRAVLHCCWGGLTKVPTEAPVYFLEQSAPHSAIFPRMHAVIHHGGPGTIATALRAGLPQMAVPFIPDQRFWGRRLARFGIGPAPIEIDRLNAADLRTALQQLVGTDGYRQQAVRIGTAMVDEPAARRVVEVIEDQIRRWPPSSRAAAPASALH